MNKTIYFIRHSEPMNVKNEKSKDDFQLKNEKMILSIEGEKKAKILSENKELENIDVVDDFGERKFNIDFSKPLSVAITEDFISNYNNMVEEYNKKSKTYIRIKNA